MIPGGFPGGEGQWSGGRHGVHRGEEAADLQME